MARKRRSVLYTNFSREKLGLLSSPATRKTRDCCSTFSCKNSDGCKEVRGSRRDVHAPQIPLLRCPRRLSHVLTPSSRTSSLSPSHCVVSFPASVRQSPVPLAHTSRRWYRRSASASVVPMPLSWLTKKLRTYYRKRKAELGEVGQSLCHHQSLSHMRT